MDLNTVSSEVMDEFYDLTRQVDVEVIDRIRVQDSNAVFFAGYGTAAMTFLAGSVSLWLKFGGHFPALLFPTAIGPQH
jgi:hypothetical protein